MDLNQLLVWFVICICTVLIIRALIFRQKKGWFIVYCSILVITALMSYLIPDVAGFVAASLWGIFVFLPLVGFLKVNQMVDEQRYDTAHQISLYLRWVHPADGWLEQPEILRALAMGKRGEIQPAFHILQRYQSVTTRASRRATALLYAMESRWEELLMWLRLNMNEPSILRDGDLALYYFRSLGETGDINSLLQLYQNGGTQLEKSASSENIHLIRLYALAFAGDVEYVEKLFEGTLSIYSESFQTFWLATTKMIAGDIAFARQQLQALQTNSERARENAIRWRLSQLDNFSPPELTPSSRKILTNIHKDIRQENRYEVINVVSEKTPYATYALMGINVLFFLVEVALLKSNYRLDFLLWGIKKIECLDPNCSYFNSEINTMLGFLGGLMPTAVAKGEWWRLFNANFLHFGLVHLLMNMIGLYVLGPFVEFTFGVRRYLFAYLVSGIGAMAIFTISNLTFSNQPTMLVGASAAVISLLGVITAILLQGWLKERSRTAAKRLRVFFIIIGVQIVVDWSIPQVSGESHIFGLIMGFLIGSLLLINWKFTD